MSEQAVKSINSGTGTFAVLKDRVHDLLPNTGGKTRPVPGNELPERKPEQKPNLELLAKQLNMASRSIGRDLRFQVDMESGRSVIQVLDRETGEIIRQIPGEKIAATMQGGTVTNVRLYDELV
ncbi:MAG: flagellar protein FlaG [Gammaproteobacteria bacterium]|nr:flagellar protein FlaG [Gammaproteobacteria bacterium]MDH4313250.1 flagellar protein FlaG [Gammaproteobacteria bacterium]MDH5213544.1 flagellar protein FlaG [Gammaproteobacteria bacterium]